MDDIVDDMVIRQSDRDVLPRPKDKSIRMVRLVYPLITNLLRCKNPDWSSDSIIHGASAFLEVVGFVEA